MKQEQQDALRAPFPKEQIQKLPTGGLQLDYVSHAWVTDRLLAVDPMWTWKPLAFTEAGLPAFDSNGGYLRCYPVRLRRTTRARQV